MGRVFQEATEKFAPAAPAGGHVITPVEGIITTDILHLQGTSLVYLLNEGGPRVLHDFFGKTESVYALFPAVPCD